MIEEPVLSDLVEWAMKAGSILRAGYGNHHYIDHKGPLDLVTETDRQSEDYILKQIQERFPTHTIVTEETGLINGSGGGKWFIDPLDGTANYAHHLPFFTVSIAYALHGKMKLGVVYDPMREECFSAELGKGAWLNSRPVHVSDVQKLEDSLLCTGFSHGSWDTPRDNLANFNYFARRCQGVRRLGSAALDMCYVACGRLDGYWDTTLSAWDLAASTLIIQEAGGRVTTLSGEPDFMKAPYETVCANPHLHAILLEGLETVKTQTHLC